MGSNADPVVTMIPHRVEVPQEGVAQEPGLVLVLANFYDAVELSGDFRYIDLGCHLIVVSANC